MTRIWVTTPVYFDVASFLILRERVRTVLLGEHSRRDVDVRFVVVDDSAGRDPDITKLRGIADTRIIDAPFNLGHQRAIVFGLRKLSGSLADDDIVVTMDADGEDRPRTCLVSWTPS
jgi:hypothetical protein